MFEVGKVGETLNIIFQNKCNTFLTVTARSTQLKTSNEHKTNKIVLFTNYIFCVKNTMLFNDFT